MICKNQWSRKHIVYISLNSAKKIRVLKHTIFGCLYISLGEDLIKSAHTQEDNERWVLPRLLAIYVNVK